MKAVRISQRGNDSTPGPAKSKRNVIVLAAPTDEAFIETVDRFEVNSRDANVVAGKLRLLGVAQPKVVLILEPLLKKSLPLTARDISEKLTGQNRERVDL